MGYTARMELAVFRKPEDAHLRASAVGYLCGAFQGLAEDYLRAHPELPRVDALIRSGRIIPRNAPRVCDASGCFIAEDPWQDIPTILSNPDRSADERDLAVWRAAEQTVRDGHPSRVTFLRQDLSPVGKLYVARMTIGLFNGPSDRDLSDRAIRRLCWAFQQGAEDYLRAHPEVPRIYDLINTGKLRYQREDKICDARGCRTVEDPWQDPPRTLELGEGDCEDVGTLCAAERRVRDGLDARADILAKDLPPPDGRRLYHIVTKYRAQDLPRVRALGIPLVGDGWEDACLPAGMKNYGV